jgi:hypothetical protein
MDDEKTEQRSDKPTGELVVDQAVVSLSAIAELSGKLDGVRRLIVRRKAVVTPAVHDLLRQRQIELAYRSEVDGKPNKANETSAPVIDSLRLIIGVAEMNNMQLDLLLKLLARASVAIQRLASASLLPTIDDLAKQLAAPATIGLLLTSEPAAAVCLSNRLAGVRAMAAGDAGTLTALGATARAVGANLLIVDPAGRGPFAMKQLIDRFFEGAPRVCPPQWRGRLD